MASLTHPHWEAVPPLLRDLLAEIGQMPFAGRFYLAGGTALALQLGHRVSVDLDFFSDVDEVGDDSRAEIVAAFKQRRTTEALENVFGNLLMKVEDTHVGFFSYGYPLLEPPAEVLGVRVASLLDIGMMKLDALISRGARKDFYDLYFIAQQVPLEEMLYQGPVKYPYAHDYEMMALTSLTDFDNADRDVAVETFDGVPWETVKDFFVAEARRLGQLWFET
jgi:predicted nucleotidyltransferase component of viral defense system